MHGVVFDVHCGPNLISQFVISSSVNSCGAMTYEKSTGNRSGLRLTAWSGAAKAVTPYNPGQLEIQHNPYSPNDLDPGLGASLDRRWLRSISSAAWASPARCSKSQFPTSRLQLITLKHHPRIFDNTVCDIKAVSHLFSTSSRFSSVCSRASSTRPVRLPGRDSHRVSIRRRR